MARKSKKQVQQEQNSQEVNSTECKDEQTTFNTDPISVLVEDGEVENAV